MSTKEAPAPPATAGLLLKRSTVALFVGVSNYDDRAGVWSTPASTLSAALIRSTFYAAAKLSGQPENRFTILADLRMNPRDSDSPLVVQYLTRLEGTNGLVHPDDDWRSNMESPNLLLDPGQVRPEAPASLNYFGEGKLVTKERILTALSATVDQATTTAKTDESLLLLIYVSAHGVTGPDGHPYILPADADAKDPSTWISYEQFLEPIYGIMRKQNLAQGEDDDTRPAAIVILDTCQDPSRLGLGHENLEKPHGFSRPGVIVVEATSPGNFAWYWKSTSEESGVRTVEKEFRFGFPRPPQAEPRGPFRRTETAWMSVLPVASQYALKTIIDQGQPEHGPRLISVGHWLGKTAVQVDTLQEAIPAALKSGRWQKVQIQIDPSEPDFAVFEIKDRNP